MIEDNRLTKTFKPIFTITNKITSGLTRIERARGFLDAATLSETWVREMCRPAGNGLIFDNSLNYKALIHHQKNKEPRCA